MYQSDCDCRRMSSIKYWNWELRVELTPIFLLDNLFHRLPGLYDCTNLKKPPGRWQSEGANQIEKANLIHIHGTQMNPARKQTSYSPVTNNFSSEE